MYSREEVLGLLNEILGQGALREAMLWAHGPYIGNLIEELIENPQLIIIFPDIHIADFYPEPDCCPCARLTFGNCSLWYEDELPCPGCGLSHWMCECGDCRCETLYNDQNVPYGVNLIGESVNHCVADVVNGTVREKDVIKIRANITGRSLGDWIGCLHGYLHMPFWHNSDPEKCVRTFWRLFHQGKIDQLLLRGESLPSGSFTWWRQPCPIHD